jgi:hypothetical protein
VEEIDRLAAAENLADRIRAEFSHRVGIAGLLAPNAAL